MGGSTPRILSIDDYYSIDDGSPVPWQEDQEEQYRQNLLKSLKRNLDDGHFPFIIVDALHLLTNEVVEVVAIARSRAFSVFLVDLPDRGVPGSTARKCSENDIEVRPTMIVLLLLSTSSNGNFIIENEDKLAGSAG